MVRLVGLQALLSATCTMLATDAAIFDHASPASRQAKHSSIGASTALGLLGSQQPSAPWSSNGQPAMVLATAAPQPLSAGRALPLGNAQQQQALNSDSDASECTPQCSWECESPKCDEICEPVCQPPRCETRCAGMDTSGCAIECDKPQCAVMCPERFCPKKDCASCTSQCSEPMCSLKCHNMQKCRNECEQPDCVWNCKAPLACPAPQCRMICESPKTCQGSTYKQLPPLLPGETAVQSFAAPLNIQSRTATTMPVPVMSLEALPPKRSTALRTSSMLTVRRMQTTIVDMPVVMANGFWNVTRGSF